MPNFQRLQRVPGFEYDNFIATSQVAKKFHLKDGNTIIQDKEGRLFNVHPKTNSRYNKETQKNEIIPPSYPVRWQLMAYDVPEEIKDQIE